MGLWDTGRLIIPFRRSFPGGTSDFVTVDPSTTHETRHVIEAGEHPSMGSAKAECNDAQYVKDLRGAFSSVPRPKARWQDRYMKIMIVGETGQGEREHALHTHTHPAHCKVAAFCWSMQSKPPYRAPRVEVP